MSTFHAGALAINVDSTAVSAALVDLLNAGWLIAGMTNTPSRFSQRTTIHAIPPRIDDVSADIMRRKLEYTYKEAA